MIGRISWIVPAGLASAVLVVEILEKAWHLKRVTIRRAAFFHCLRGQPQVQFERTGEPKVVYRQAEGQPRIMYERMTEEEMNRQQAAQAQQGQTDQTAQPGSVQQQAQQTGRGQVGQPLTDQERQVYRERFSDDEADTTGAVDQAAVRTQAYGVRDLERMDVHNGRGEKVGSVDRIILGPNKRQYLVVGEGGFLGIGRDRAAFPLERLWVRGDRLVIRSVTEDDIENIDDLSNVDGFQRVGANERANLRIWQ